MPRKIVFCVFFISSIILSSAYAGEVKMTTYYPSPYGEYKKTTTKTLGVGDTNGDGSVNGSDAPDPATREGDAWIAKRIRIGGLPPENIDGYGLYVSNKNGPTGMIIRHSDSLSTGPFIRGDQSDGTVASPTATTAGRALFQIGSTGYDGTKFAGGASIVMQPTQNWTTTANGSRIIFTTVANDTVASVFGPERMRIDQNGNVGIGTTSPGATLNVNGTALISGNAGIGTTAVPAYPLEINKIYNTAGGYKAALNTYTRYNTSGAGANYGVRIINDAGHSSGVMPDLEGINVLSRNLYDGTVSSLRGLTARVDNISATGTVTEGIGVLIQDNIGAGTITNNYGIYQVGTTAKNYFGGNVGIGTTGPQAALDVASSTTGVLVPRIASDPTGVNGMIYYNSTSNKFRSYENGVWKDLGQSAAAPTTGYYTGNGNGTAGQALNLGFSPKVVMIVSVNGNSVVKTNTMGGTNAFLHQYFISLTTSGWIAHDFTGSLVRIDTTGFTVFNNNVNKNNVGYHYIAWPS